MKEWKRKGDQSAKPIFDLKQENRNENNTRTKTFNNNKKTTSVWKEVKKKKNEKKRTAALDEDAKSPMCFYHLNADNPFFCHKYIRVWQETRESIIQTRMKRFQNSSFSVTLCFICSSYERLFAIAADEDGKNVLRRRRPATEAWMDETTCNTLCILYVCMHWSFRLSVVISVLWLCFRMDSCCCCLVGSCCVNACLPVYVWCCVLLFLYS